MQCYFKVNILPPGSYAPSYLSSWPSSSGNGDGWPIFQVPFWQRSRIGNVLIGYGHEAHMRFTLIFTRDTANSFVSVQTWCQSAMPPRLTRFTKCTIRCSRYGTHRARFCFIDKTLVKIKCVLTSAYSLTFIMLSCQCPKERFCPGCLQPKTKTCTGCSNDQLAQFIPCQT